VRAVRETLRPVYLLQVVGHLYIVGSTEASIGFAFSSGRRRAIKDDLKLNRSMVIPKERINDGRICHNIGSSGDNEIENIFEASGGQNVLG